MTRKQIVAKRLALLRENWLKVTQDLWVLDRVTGYRIKLQSTSAQLSPPRAGVCSSQEQSLINEEISKMLFKRAIAGSTPSLFINLITWNHQSRYSCWFLIRTASKKCVVGAVKAIGVSNIINHIEFNLKFLQ